MLIFDTGKFLADHFETPANLLVQYRSVDADPPNISAIEKWFQRGSIPGNHLAVLMYIVELQTGNGVNLNNYIKGGESH